MRIALTPRHEVYKKQADRYSIFVVSMKPAADSIDISSIEWSIDAAIPKETPFGLNSVLLLMPSHRSVKVSSDSWKNQ
jgi:hypothetical protein